MRTKIVQFRVTEGELKTLQAAAAVAGLRPSDWIRQLALQSANIMAGYKELTQTEDLLVTFSSTGMVKNVSASAE